MTRSNPFSGKRRIVSSDTWDAEALDAFEPAHIVFGPRGRGELCFIAVSASIDYRVASRDGSSIVEFSWAEDDDGSPISGRGWARRAPEGLVGRLFIHEGDEAEFGAKRFGGKKDG